MGVRKVYCLFEIEKGDFNFTYKLGCCVVASMNMTKKSTKVLKWKNLPISDGFVDIGVI